MDHLPEKLLAAFLAQVGRFGELTWLEERGVELQEAKRFAMNLRTFKVGLQIWWVWQICKMFYPFV
jgi:hypothetical protein